MRKVKKIVIITGQHMTANPRVWKAANCLAEEGYSIVILTTVYDRQKLAHDRELLHPAIVYKASVNLIKGEGSFSDVVLSRLWRRLAMIRKRYFRQDSKHLILYNPSKQLRTALSERADLYIAHQEAGLITGCQLIRLGKKVSFDFEDWYSQDYINRFRPAKLLQVYERAAVKLGSFVTFPSAAMLNAVKVAYNTTTRLEVIYNGFDINENSTSSEAHNSNKLVWFSQVVGPERGLETLCRAMQYVSDSCTISLLGSCDEGYKKKLRGLLPDNHSLNFHKPIAHVEITRFLSQHSIGLAIEQAFPQSRNTTITNKILQYLQAGLKVLATATEGQKEVATMYSNQLICLVDHDQPEQWAYNIKLLLNNRSTSAEQIREVFSNNFSWNIQARKLISLVAAEVN